MPAGAAAVKQRPGPKTPNEIYLEGELQRAIKERDTLRRALEAQGGSAAFFRQMAKDVSKGLGDATRIVGGLREQVHEQRLHAIRFSEQLDTLRGQVDTLKVGLWEIWTGLDDTNPAKQQLWEVWAALP